VVSVPLGVILKISAAKNGPVKVGAGVGPAVLRCSVEVPVSGLDQPSEGTFAVRFVKTVKRRERATWGNFEDRAIAVGPAVLRCSVEIPVGALDQAH
jgi:hypothetical protein